MKIFTNKDGYYSEKINFVDDNNVFVGYDLSQNCCENAGWFISDKEEDDIKKLTNELETDWSKWNFDARYFKEVSSVNFEDGGAAIFKIVNGKKKKFIHIFNAHNGYYGHGFEVKHGGVTVKEGCL